MKKITAALVGAGMRGAYSYAPYALEKPEELEFVAVAEPDDIRREKFKKLHNIPDGMCFSSWEELLNQPKLADAVLICTQDKMHYEPAIKACEKGYNVLLEKPMSNNPAECYKIGEAANKSKQIMSICHVLRYTPFFSTIKQLIDEGKIGKLVTIQHNENIGYYHYAHSYVRGNWRNSKEASPIILAKSCHDMDILLWLAGAACKKLSSYGSLTHFKSENAPAGVPERCTDNCPCEDECIFSSKKLYSTGGFPGTYFASAISSDTSPEGIEKALKEGPYGRCVYKCDNDVADHQVVNMEFANGVTAVFTMCAFSSDISRTIKLLGTNGEIRGIMGIEKTEIEVVDFRTAKKSSITIDTSMENGHGGGDSGLISNFVKLLRENAVNENLTSASVSVQSHLMAFAAEKSRIENCNIDMDEYVEQIRKSI